MMVILEVPGQKPPQMALVQDDHVVQAFAADAANEPFHVGILPWALGGDDDLFDPHVPHPLPNVRPVETITVAQEIPRGLVPREGLNDLLRRPLGRGMLGDVEVDDATSVMGQNQ